MPFCTNGNPLQYSCLENPMDGGAWWTTVHGVAKSQTRLSDFTFTSTSLCYLANFQHFHCAESDPCLVERTNGFIKTNLAKPLLWVLLISDLPLLKLILSLFEMATGHSIHLAPASFDSQLINGEMFQFCTGLIASIKNNHTL